MSTLLTGSSGQGRKRKIHGALIAAAAVFLTAAGTTLAFLLSETSPVVNLFQKSQVACEITETFEEGGTEKNDVSIKNTGNTAAYIRTVIVVSWLDKSGNVSAYPPVPGEDYSMELNLSEDDGWIRGDDGYYYFPYAVAARHHTEILIKECRQIREKTGYRLSVDCIASAVQSSPASAAAQAWNITVTNRGRLEVNALDT